MGEGKKAPNFGPHHPSGPHFFWVRAPTLRAQPFGPQPFGPPPFGPPLFLGQGPHLSGPHPSPHPLGPPTLRGPPLRGPHPSGPPPFGPPTLLAPTFSGLGPGLHSLEKKEKKKTCRRQPSWLQSVTKHVLLGMVLGEITDGLHLPQHAKGISFQLCRNLRVYPTRTSMKKSRGDSQHCSLVYMTLEANSMVHSQWLNLLGRSPGVQSSTRQQTLARRAKSLKTLF